MKRNHLATLFAISREPTTNFFLAENRVDGIFFVRKISREKVTQNVKFSGRSVLNDCGKIEDWQITGFACT
jgi:hypothetical protein